MARPFTHAAFQHQYNYSAGTATEVRLSIRTPKTPHEYREVMAEVAKWIDPEFDQDGDLDAAVFRVLVEFAGYYTELICDETPRAELRVSDFQATLQSVMENLEMRASDGEMPQATDSTPPPPTVGGGKASEPVPWADWELELLGCTYRDPETQAILKKELQRVLVKADTLEYARKVLNVMETGCPDRDTEHCPNRQPSNPELWH